MTRDDDSTDRSGECAYCGRTVTTESAVPETTDDEGWRRAAEGHAADCEWVTTRAHRLAPKIYSVHDVNRRLAERLIDQIVDAIERACDRAEGI